MKNNYKEDKNEIYAKLGIDSDVLACSEKILTRLKDRFDAIDETAEYNQLKVLNAMQECHVSESCFQMSSGYGYNDLGRSQGAL